MGLYLEATQPTPTIMLKEKGRECQLKPPHVTTGVS